MKSTSLVAFALILALAAGGATAHHSFAAFDATKTVRLDGTVKGFEFTNPHCWLKILVPKDGGEEEWNIEMASVASLYRKGLRRDSLKPGDKIKLDIHPLRSGEPGGAAGDLIELNGQKMPPGLLGSPQS